MRITKPLTKKQGKALQKKNGFITVELALDLTDLIGTDIEGLNDLVNERILESGYMGNLAYRVIGHTPGEDGGHFISGQVLLSVTGDVSEWD
jgi:hypothetical protein